MSLCIQSAWVILLCKWITNLASDAGVIFIIQMLWQFMILELLKLWGLGAGHMIT